MKVGDGWMVSKTKVFGGFSAVLVAFEAVFIAFEGFFRVGFEFFFWGGF